MIEGLTYEAAFEIASKRYELKRGLTGIPLNAMWLVIGSDETGGYTQRVIVFGNTGLIETIDVRDSDKPNVRNWHTYSPHEISKFNCGWAGWSVGTIGECWKVRDDRIARNLAKKTKANCAIDYAASSEITIPGGSPVTIRVNHDGTITIATGEAKTQPITFARGT